jgi:MOSC domain-containing protein YiiM
MAVMLCESVNVGRPQEVTWNRKTFTTAIVKRPVAGRVAITGVNVEGDDQADRSVHGGTDKAVYAYGSNDYDWWHEEHGIAVEPGLFGENLTLRGIDLGACLIGERWRIGGALLEVSEPRIPCFKLAYRMNDARFIKAFSQALRPGTYFRILEEGVVGAGDPIELQSRPGAHDLSVRECMRIFLFDHDQRHKLASVEALGAGWRKWGADRHDA